MNESETTIMATPKKTQSATKSAPKPAVKTSPARASKPAAKAPVSQHSAKDKEPVLVEVVDHATAEAERAVERDDQARVDGVENPPRVTVGPDSELQVHSADPAHQHIHGGVDDAPPISN